MRSRHVAVRKEPWEWYVTFERNALFIGIAESFSIPSMVSVTVRLVFLYLIGAGSSGTAPIINQRAPNLPDRDKIPAASVTVIIADDIARSAIGPSPMHCPMSEGLA
jgi:hypothetical protein